MHSIKITHWLAFLFVALVFSAPVPAALAQQRPYIGFVYPAGGQQGTTFPVRLGGQYMDEVTGVIVTGEGVTVNAVECHRFLNNEEMQMLKDQLQLLKPAKPATPATPANPAAQALQPKGKVPVNQVPPLAPPLSRTAKFGQEAPLNLVSRLEARIAEHVQTPACRSIATLVFASVTIAADAPAGEREIRLVTPRGVSNPMAFHVGQLKEYARKPMLSASLQVLGKETQALRKRPAEEAEDRIELPCTCNGQIASGEVNRYRFVANKGQKLVVITPARQLIPYIADAVPGWFQPVLVLYDAAGKELDYDDCFQFKPDPVNLFEVPRTGEYVLAIHDDLYRGREDFTYRISIGEIPFITSIFPLGAVRGEEPAVKMRGWFIDKAHLTLPGKDAPAGIYQLAAERKGFVSNRVLFSVNTLPECFSNEHNTSQAHAQKVTLPVIVNGKIEKANEWNVFELSGKANDTVVAEVTARRLDSPLDSVLKLTDADGKVLAFNDDHEDPGSGLNTHHADSYLTAKLPADGSYYVYIGDAGRKGGPEYGYRLRLSAPQPDFALRVVPSSAAFRSNGSVNVTVYAMRKDGFSGPIKVGLRDAPAGFTAAPATVKSGEDNVRLAIKSNLKSTREPVDLVFAGSASPGETEVSNIAVPAEDRMQAFLWRHLVPATDLKVLVFDPDRQEPQRHAIPPRPPAQKLAAILAQLAPPAPKKTVAPEPKPGPSPEPIPVPLPGRVNGPLAGATTPVATTGAGSVASPLAGPPAPAGVGTTGGAQSAPDTKPKFTQKQVESRLKQLKRLFEEGLLAGDFYWARVSECETAQ